MIRTLTPTHTTSLVDPRLLLLSFLQVHAYIISYLKKEMPSLFGREKKKEELIMRLPEIYTILQREHHISPGDFPNVSKMQVLELHRPLLRSETAYVSTALAQLQITFSVSKHHYHQC